MVGHPCLWLHRFGLHLHIPLHIFPKVGYGQISRQLFPWYPLRHIFKDESLKIMFFKVIIMVKSHQFLVKMSFAKKMLFFGRLNAMETINGVIFIPENVELLSHHTLIIKNDFYFTNIEKSKFIPNIILLYEKD